MSVIAKGYKMPAHNSMPLTCEQSLMGRRQISSKGGNREGRTSRFGVLDSVSLFVLSPKSL